MTSLMSNWLMSLLVSAPTAALILVLVLTHRERTRWMRIFCAKLEIPKTTMEDEVAPQPMITVPAPDHRRRISVPIPGANIFRNGNR